jgi:fructose-specific phosphotransferase system IIC component
MSSHGLVDQPTLFPTRKVIASTIGAAVGTAAVWGTTMLAETNEWLGFLVMPEFQALYVVLGAVVGAFVSGWLFREWDVETIPVEHEN